MTTVSILIPCYNSERFIAEAVESALGQTHTDIEVVVVDDGSTDGSVQVLKSFGDRIILETGPNHGACVARNRAFELSSGQYIQFLDADDKLAPTKVASQLQVLVAQQLDMVLCKIGLFGDDRGERPEKRPHPNPVGDPMMYFARHGIQTAAPLYQRSLFESSGGFLPGLKRGQEADLHLRIGSLNPKIAMLDEILVWVRMHDGERITNRPADINQIVTTLMYQADFLDQHKAWNPERRDWIATQMLQASRSCFATGDRVVATAGLTRALQIDPIATRHDRLFRKMLTACLGVNRAEVLIDGIRRIVR